MPSTPCSKQALKLKNLLSGLRFTSKVGCSSDQGNEDFRFSTATWNSPTLTFTLKAAVENEKLVCDFVQVDVYVEEIGPIAFWGKSRHLTSPYETHKAHVEIAKT